VIRLGKRRGRQGQQQGTTEDRHQSEQERRRRVDQVAAATASPFFDDARAEIEDGASVKARRGPNQLDDETDASQSIGLADPTRQRRQQQ